MPREVASARQGKGMFNFPRFVRDPLAALYTRLGARRESLATITRRYDTAHAATLRTLDEVRDDEWQRGAPFWGEGFITIEGLFRAQSRHLMEHRGDVLSIFQDDMTTANRRSHRGNA